MSLRARRQPVPAAAQATYYADLNAAVDQASPAGSPRTPGFEGKQVLVNAHDFLRGGHRAQSAAVEVDVARAVRHRARHTRGAGVRRFLKGSEDDMVIFQGVWRVLSASGITPARLHLTVKVTERTEGGYRTQSADGRVEGVDARLLTPDLDSWGRHVVKELENRVRDRRHRDIHVGAFDVTGEVNEPEIVREDLEAFWLEPAFAESRRFRLVTRSTGGGSDGVLHVRVRFGREQVNFRLKVEDNQGGQVTAATVRMARKVLGDILGDETPPSSIVHGGPQVFIVARQRVSSKAALKDWSAIRPILAIGSMGTAIRRSNVRRYLEGLGASMVVMPRSEVYPLLERGVIDGVVTVDDRLVKELRPLYRGPPLELRSRSDFNESDDVVIVTNR